MKINTLGALLGLALLGMNGSQAAQTNLVQTLHIQLIAYAQGGTTTNANLITRNLETTRISNRDIIQAIGTATSNTFSPRATLVVVKELPDGDAAIVIRDGTNRLAVTGFFNHEQDDNAVGRARLNTSTRVLNGMEYSFHSFALKDHDDTDLDLHFKVSGLAQASFMSLVNRQGGIIGETYEYVVPVAGTGQVGGKDVLIQGMISGKGRKIEIAP